MQKQARQRKRCMCVGSNCNMHQMHLSVQAGLRRVEYHVRRQKRPWKYFGSVSKVMHCWRERARPVFDTWARLHGAESHSVFLGGCILFRRWVGLPRSSSQTAKHPRGRGQRHLRWSPPGGLAEPARHISASAFSHRDRRRADRPATSTSPRRGLTQEHWRTFFTYTQSAP